MRVGRIVNKYSNFLEMLAVDARHAVAYGGVGEDEAPDEDYARARRAKNRGRFRVGKGTGVLAVIGGCGSAEVHRLGNAIVIPEQYTGERDGEAEAELDRAIATHPTTAPKKLGTVAVPSGVLVLMGLLEPGPKVDRAQAKKKGAVKIPDGCAIAVKPGRYDVWREELSDAEGRWGTMPSRVRIVPAGTKLIAGAPIAAVAPAASPREATDGVRLRLDPKQKWVALRSIAVAKDGRAFAGQMGGGGVACWDESGALVWQGQVFPKRRGAKWEAVVIVQLVGKDLLAFAPEARTLLVLDPASGRARRALPVLALCMT